MCLHLPGTYFNKFRTDYSRFEGKEARAVTQLDVQKSMPQSKGFDPEIPGPGVLEI